MKPHINLQAMRTIGQLVLAGGLMLTAAEGHGQTEAVPALVLASGTAPARPARAPLTVVGFDTSIRQQDFAGLGKPVVLRMQQNLEVIYRALPDWQSDFAKRQRPLDDGVVGPVTLRWLQRYSFTFKFSPGKEIGKAFPVHMERMAAFAVAHPAELDILLSKPFEAWDSTQPAARRAQDFEIRRVADAAALIELVNRYRASLSKPAAPRLSAVVESDGYHTYVLNDADLEVLGGKFQVAALLATFKDKPYPSKEAIKVALQQGLKGRDHVLNKVWPVVDKSLQPYDGYLINAANLARLKKEGVAAGSIDELAAFGTVYLKSREAFETFVADKIAAGELAMTDDALAQLAETIKVFDNYHLDQQALDTIASQLRGSVLFVGVPASVIKMLMQIREVDYPEAGIFHSAARSKIAYGLGMCRLNTPINNAHLASLVISNDELALLRKDVEALGTVASDGSVADPQMIEKQFAAMTALRNTPVLCSQEQKAAALAIVNWLYDTYLKTAIDSAARKNMPEHVEPIRITGSDCGCALDDLAGVAYGFYPYWWEQKGRQTMNFRVLNRVAYYGLTVDHTGDFRLGANSFDIHDGSAQANDFVRIARQHNSKVDWLIQKNDWGREWHDLNPQSKKAVFNRMLVNISTLLNAPLTSLRVRLKSMASFAVSEPARRGDGVTLYFPNYPDDKDSTALFNDFYRALRVEMAKHHLWLNILVSQDTLATGKNGSGGAFGLYNLINLRKQSDAAIEHARLAPRENHEYLLVLLNEPSADSKKALRLDLENDSMVHGAERADFLRSIVPIIHFDDHNWQQLDDDIVYSRDNFGGVGFWAPDFDNLAQKVKTENQSCLQAKQIAVCLLKNVRDEPIADSIPGPVEFYACVHRWVLHWIMLILVAAGIVLVALFFTFCKVQNFIKEHFLWVQVLIVLPALLIFVLLLMYDPFMLSLSHGNLPFFISAGIIMLGVIIGYRFWRAQRQVPQRERGMPQREGTGFPILVWTIESNERGFQWLIKNRGSGYAIIKKVEILLDGNPVVDAKTALESVMESGNNVQWKSVPLVGQKLEPGKQLAGLSIANSEAARAFEQKLNSHALAVKITYSGPSNEHWSSDGAGIMSVSGGA